jgi:hypothetical protein
MRAHASYRLLDGAESWQRGWVGTVVVQLDGTDWKSGLTEGIAKKCKQAA